METERFRSIKLVHEREYRWLDMPVGSTMPKLATLNQQKPQPTPDTDKRTQVPDKLPRLGHAVLFPDPTRFTGRPNAADPHQISESPSTTSLMERDRAAIAYGNVTNEKRKILLQVYHNYYTQKQNSITRNPLSRAE